MLQCDTLFSSNIAYLKKSLRYNKPYGGQCRTLQHKPDEQTTNNQQPTTNNQPPTTNNKQPTTNNQQLILVIFLIVVEQIPALSHPFHVWL